MSCDAGVAFNSRHVKEMTTGSVRKTKGRLKKGVHAVRSGPCLAICICVVLIAEGMAADYVLNKSSSEILL